MTRTKRVLGAIIGVIGLIGTTAAVLPARASDPASHDVTVPTTPNQPLTVTWTGTIPPGSNPSNTCLSGSLSDTHTVNITVPPNLYQSQAASFSFKISWVPTNGDENTHDEILTVLDPASNDIGDSDGSDTTEQVNQQNLEGGAYTVEACGFANTDPQPYTGTLTIVTAPPTPPLASAPSQGLAFSASVPADPQRDEAEPNMTIDGKGNIYTCGPTGFSNGADYSQISLDGGDQFHLLGQPPRGQQSLGGGGDCAFATAPTANPDGTFNYTYSGLGGLNSFATANSTDEGKTLTPGNDPVAGVDRQWETFTDKQNVYLIYNRQQPRDTVVQHSTDGGVTWPDAPLVNTLQIPVGAPAPDFPGPIKTDLNPAHNVDNNGTPLGKPLLYFPWTKGNGVYLSVSKDGGTTWNDCLAAMALGDTRAGFPTADQDSDGTIYVVYAEQANFHTWITHLPISAVNGCKNPVASGDPAPKDNPGFTTPLQVDRDAVRTTVFPWVAAGGAPGRVAVAFYGTETDGNPNTGTFKATWDVYVNQSLNANAAGATFSQVKATTHPFHYDSICLNGLGCDTAVPPGDRSLADFFAISYDSSKPNGRLSVVYDSGAKKPDEATGHVATPMVFHQIAGPSNGGGTVTADPRPPLRTSSADPGGDALSNYSALAPAAPNPTNEPAADFTNVAITPDAATGGFTVTMTLASLAPADVTNALNHQNPPGGSLLWIWRFANGFQNGAAVASTTDGSTFTFGYADYTTGTQQCGGSDSEKCEVYPQTNTITGNVNAAAKTITMTVPKSMLRYLTGPTGANQRPGELAAQTGTRFEDGTAISLVNSSPDQSAQAFMYTLDNTPAFDFLLPAANGVAATVPSAPTGVTANVLNTNSALVKWTPSASDGGSPITGYVVTSSPGGLTAQTGPNSTAVRVDNLASGTTYTFTVHALNGVGPSPESAPSNAITTASSSGGGNQPAGVSDDPAAPGCLTTGYWTVAADGGVFSFNSPFYGSTGSLKLNKPIVGMAHTPTCGGYWMVATDGGIFTFGDGQFFGSTGSLKLNKPIVGMAATPSGKGYWLVASDGGIFTFGDAAFLGSMGGTPLNKPVVGMAATPTGKGYWLVASDGGIFSFGDAQFFGSTGALKLNKPVVGMARTPKGDGYWFVASDGGIFAFGPGAPFLGSQGGSPLNKPVVGMGATTVGLGYWLVASDGGIFTHGDAPFAGSTGAIKLNQPMVGMAGH